MHKIRLKLERNPDLAVGADQKPRWNLPENRRWGFRNLHRINRSALAIRAPDVLMLAENPLPQIGKLQLVQQLTSAEPFSAMAVIQGQDLLFEAYAPDMSAEQPHSIQSISKTPMHLIMGRLVEQGSVNLREPVAHYLPEMGSGYATATLQQVLDMDLVNNFNEDYADAYDHPPRPGETVGYNREEIAMGWRLPPPGEATFSCRDFLLALTSDNITNPSDETQYRSPNTDVLAWIAERVTGRPFRDLLVEVVEAAGIEGSYQISTDHHGTPVIAGGASMTARDLARYGLLFAREGLGVKGDLVGSPSFMKKTMSGRGTHVTDCRGWVRYSNHSYTNGRWIGHPGFAGQFLMADPETETSIAFFSVLETKDGDQEGYFAQIMRMGEDILGLLQKKDGPSDDGPQRLDLFPRVTI